MPKALFLFAYVLLAVSSLGCARFKAEHGKLIKVRGVTPEGSVRVNLEAGGKKVTVFAPGLRGGIGGYGGPGGSGESVDPGCGAGSGGVCRWRS